MKTLVTLDRKFQRISCFISRPFVLYQNFEILAGNEACHSTHARTLKEVIPHRDKATIASLVDL